MTELQNDRMTDRTKTICPPIFDLGGIKIINAIHVSKLNKRHKGHIAHLRNHFSE